jgi:hypothetical protein
MDRVIGGGIAYIRHFAGGGRISKTQLKPNRGYMHKIPVSGLST